MIMKSKYKILKNYRIEMEKSAVIIKNSLSNRKATRKNTIN